ncbi:antirestriction protein ArdC [Mesonia algae]|uniref:Antirestriction protein ArdC n=1 Tax=Mesonia algae TaxID=213248 RepID=A0A2W7ISJ5_9FLAO|nr:zincin-like metallopeptidase domain-containing protein [Mesonia algae]PZW41633.1 antirestriction protein ArdC [Mesonia algae]
MLSSIKTYNGLNGEILTRAEVENLINKAKAEDQKHILQKLEQLLASYPEAKSFDIETTPQDEILEENLLPGIDYLAIPEEGETPGLGKPVSPDDIYQMITDLIINTIKKVGHLPWQREWEKTNLYQGKQAINFESKNPYRGINYFLLNFKVEIKDGEKILTRRNFDVPYFLTFNQIKKNKGELKKGSTGFKVVYFTKLYKVDEKGKNGKELSFGTYNKKKFDAWVDKNINNLNRDADYYKNSYLPILKYYNVFNADDITGIDWGELPKNPNADKPLKERIEIAELIVNNMPNAPKILFEGDQPAYYPDTDSILMTPIEAFKDEQSYYTTIFHELTHSTGHGKRLKRFAVSSRSESTKRDNAFEELIAEMGAVFLSAEAGTLFKTLDNSAKYLSGWNGRLVKEMKEDNRYFFRASSKSQAAADYILDRDKEGNPAYLKELENKPKKEEAKETTKTEKSKKETSNETIYPFSKSEISYDLAKRAHSGTSFSPEKRAEQEQNSHFSYLKEVYNNAKKYSKSQKTEENFEAAFDKFHKGYLKRKISELESRSRLLSTMITGPANFPTRRAEKNSNAHHNKLTELIDYSKYAEDRMRRELTARVNKPVKTGEKGALEVLEQKLEKAKREHELNKSINKIVSSVKRKKLSKEETIEKILEEVKKLEVSDKFLISYKRLMTDNLIWAKQGTQNSLAKVKRYEQRVKQEKNRSTENKMHDFKDFKILENAEQNRYQILFDDIPSEEIRKVLKSHSFRWSNKNKAWQRQITGNASYSLRKFVIPALKKIYEKIETPQKENLKEENKEVVEEPQKVNKETGQIALLGEQPQEVCEVQETTATAEINSVTQPKQNPNSLAARLQASQNQDFEYYKIDNPEIAKFLGRVEVKQKESIGISVTAPQGAGKTRFCFQLVDAFADNYKVGIASMEEHPASSLFLSKVPEYISNKNIPNVEAPEINTMQDLHELIMANDVIMIDSFEKLRELDKNVQVDKDLRKKYNGKLFIIIFQLTSDGKMRGGSKSQFDVDIVLLTEKFDDYKQNYIYTDKNRYNHLPASDLKYNIYDRKMLPIEGEENTATAEVNSVTQQNASGLVITPLN